MKIVLISEQQLLQNMLHIALERRNDVEIVGEYLEGKAALKAFSEMEEKDRPDLVIQGLKLADMDGIALTEQLRIQFPQLRILAVTGQSESRSLIPFLLAGGHGYLSQYPSDEEFYQAIDDVMSGRIYLNQTGLLMLEETCSHLSSLRDTVVQREVLPEGSQPCSLASCHLSEREKQVLHLYVNGYKSSEIGGILYMSVNTVETHKKRIKEKLNLTRKADLLTYAMEHGLFEDWD